jgi:protein-tyrosine phosphatase
MTSTTTPPQTGADRHVPLDGAVNFRDLGGYRTADGHAVRWKTLFRSDSLAELSADDMETVTALGLRTVCDLRDHPERGRKPDRLQAGPSLRVYPIGFQPYGGEKLVAGVKARTISPAEVAATFHEMYRRFPLEQTAIYARVLDALLEQEALPALIHCTSGKDRTGFAAAIVLMALGVPRETITEDYVVTNRHRRDLTFLLGDNTDPEALATMKQAHPEYLGAAFKSIDEKWGSDQAFVQNALGLTAPRQQRLKELLLEP